MKLSQKAREDFKSIYSKSRGIKLTDEQADLMGWQLLELASLTLKENKKGQ